MADSFVGPQEPALKDEDYRALYSMLTSSDEGQRKQAQGLAAKLTPTEEQEFFKFQRGTNKASAENRTDRTVLGMDPEIAVAGGLSIGLPMAAKGLSVAGRAGAGAKALASLGVGVVKYDVAKNVLESAGLPSPLSDMAAMAIAGYRRKGGAPTEPPQAEATVPETPPHLDLSRRMQPGGMTQQQIAERFAAAKASGQPIPMPGRMRNPVGPTRVPLPDQPAAPVAASQPPPVPAPRPMTTGTSMQPAPMPVPRAVPPPEPIAAPPVAVEPPAQAVAPGPKLSPQRALNDLALAARRAKTTLSAEDYDALKPLVQDGTPAAEAISALVKKRIEPITNSFTDHVLKIDPDAEIRISSNKDAIVIRSSKGATTETLGKGDIERAIAGAGKKLTDEYPSVTVDPTGQWQIYAKSIEARNRAIDSLPDVTVADPAAQFAARFNLPSDAERTFPPNKSGLPTKAPRADEAARRTSKR